MREAAAIFDMDEERDRKECLALAQKSVGADRELAQWLLNHPRYSGSVVSKWTGFSKSKINDLRSWAKRGFAGTPRSNESRPSTQGGVDRRRDTLKTNENFEDDAAEPDENVEDPKVVLRNILDSIKQSKAVAEAWRKILKASSFDADAKKQISDEIKLLIVKWATIQTTLAQKGKANVKDD